MKYTRVCLGIVFALLWTVSIGTAQAQYEEYIWQTFVTQDMSGAENLGSRLEEEVQRVVSAGHLAPFRFFFAEVGDEASPYYYWSSPSDVVFALSYAYPYVSSTLQSELRVYLRNEIINYPPWQASHLYIDEGTRREHYRVPTLGHYRLGWWNVDCYDSEFPWLQNLYGLWLYASNTDDWQLIEDNWDQIRSFYEARRGNDLRFYAGIGGAIGYARMAQYLGETAHRDDAVNAVNNALAGDFSGFDSTAEGVLNSFYVRGPCSSPGSGALVLPVTYDLSPEVGRFLHDHRFTEMETRFANIVYMNPAWYMSKGVNFNCGETTFQPPNSNWGAFLAEALAVQRPASELTKHVGAPYARVGDLYYIVKLASAIRARGATLWLDVRDGTPSGAQGFSMSLPAGWHLLSYPYQLESDAVTDVLASLDGAYDSVYHYDASDPDDPWKIYDVSGPPYANDLDRLPLATAFWVHLTRSATWTLSGVPASGQEIQLHEGFNMVGWPSQEVAALPEALDSISGRYEVVWGFDGSDAEAPWLSYDPDGNEWSNTLGRLVPGYGTWVYATEDCTLVLSD